MTPDELASRWAEERGGALLLCRPRGWPPGRRWRVVAALLVLAPFLAGWSQLLLEAVYLRDHGLQWRASWREVQLSADEGLASPRRAPGPLWGLESPLVPGLVVPWLLLAGVVVGAVEVVRLALYRSRRLVVVDRQQDGVSVGRRLLVAAPWLGRTFVRELLPCPGSARLVDGPRGVTLECSAPHHADDPRLARPTVVALGRLDPLDLADLARLLDAPTPGPPPPRSRRRWWLAALPALVVATGLILLLIEPWRATLTILAPLVGGQGRLGFMLDTPAWGPLRARVHAGHGGVQMGTVLPAAWLAGLALDGRPVDDASPGLRVSLNHLLRRGEFLDVDAVAPDSAPRRRRISGCVQLVEGDPIPFDVTLAPGESVTLDLADLRERADRR